MSFTVNEGFFCAEPVNSPARRKPKKPIQQAAHNITASCDVGCCDHVEKKSLKTVGSQEDAGASRDQVKPYKCLSIHTLAAAGKRRLGQGNPV